MDKSQLLEALKKAKENSSKRNFKQTVDLIIVLKGLDLKKAEHNVNTFVNLHHATGKKASVCALVGPELKAQAKEVCDEAISDDEFDKYKDKKLAKQLAGKHDFFIAQATIMPKTATAFGRVFGPKGKMPNPKAGCVVPPNANLKPLYERLQKVVKLQTKSQPIIQCKVGIESQDENEVIDNILTIYNTLEHSLPNGKHNIRNVLVKLTMGPCVKVGVKEESKGKGAKEEKKSQKSKNSKEFLGHENPKDSHKPEVSGGSEAKPQSEAPKPKEAKPESKEEGSKPKKEGAKEKAPKEGKKEKDGKKQAKK